MGRKRKATPKFVTRRESIYCEFETTLENLQETVESLVVKYGSAAWIEIDSGIRYDDFDLPYHYSEMSVCWLALETQEEADERQAMGG